MRGHLCETRKRNLEGKGYCVTLQLDNDLVISSKRKKLGVCTNFFILFDRYGRVIVSIGQRYIMLVI